MTERSLFNRIKCDQLADRIDPEYYTKDLLANEALLERFHESRLCDLVDKSKPNNIADLTSNGSFEFLRGIEFNEVDGIPFIRTQNLMDGYVDDGEVIYVNQECRSMVAKSLCETGDLIVCRKGKVGAASALPEKMNGAAISENVTRFSLLADDDGDFIAAFLNSNQGRKRFLREATGVIQKWINNEKLREIRVIRLDARAEKYIGDKVRQAERLRAWAKELRSSVDKVLDQLRLPTADVPLMVNRVSTERLETRLDPRPYRTHYIKLVDQIKAIKHSRVSDVAELASGCPVSSSDFIEGGEVPLVRIRNIGFDEFIGLDTGVTKELHKDEEKYQAKENMIVLGMDGIFRAQFFLSDELPMLVNQRVGMLTTTYIRPELLTHWLNRPEGQMQLNQWAVKTTVEHTSLSDIGRVCIPRFDADIEDGLADKLLNARRAYRYSRFLTVSAKLFVEDLIEGQITEAQLIAAEQALQAGNDALDRKILGRLKTDGIDGEGAVLFSDLDELYRLLALAEVE
ncbi:TPA: hypothetical protein SIA26_001460 [Aeromonas bestiarum]|nr:hypothetical protein [Aeromonas bestiarum]